MADTVGGSVVWNLDVVDKGFSSGLAKAGTEAQAFSNTLSKTAFQDFSKNASNAFNGVATGIATLAKVATGLFIGGALGVGIFVRQASELQSLKASFESMTGSAESANRVLKQLNKFSFETAFSSADINKAAQLLLGAGVRVEDLGSRMKQIGDIAGATGANLGALTLPLSQALARGKLQTQDFYQILNSGAGTFRKTLEEEVVKRGLGNLQDALAAGTIDTEVMTAALEKANQKGGFAFEGAIKQSKTFAGQMSNLKETVGNVALAILGIDKATGTVKPGGIFDSLTKAAQSAQKWLNQNQKTIQKFATIIVNNAIPAMIALAAAFTVAKLAAIAFNLAALSKTELIFKAVAFAVTALVAVFTFLQVKFGVFTKAFGLIKDVADVVAGAFRGVWGAVKDFANLIGDIINAAYQTVFDKIKDAVNAVKDAFKASIEWIDKHKEGLKQVAVVAGIITGPALIKLGATASVVAAQMVASAAVAAAGWIASAVSTGVAWLVQFTLMIARAIVTGATMALQGIVAAATWIAQAIVVGITWLATFSAMIARAILTAAIFVAQAVIAGFAWLIALGPVVLIIAAIAAAAFLIIKNWDRVRAFLVGVWQSVVDGARSLLNFVSNLPGTILAKIGNLGHLLYDVGRDMIRGMINGIKDMAGAAADAAKGVAKSAVDGAKSLLGIHSPSSVFAEIGKNVGQGLVQGITSTQSAVEGSISSLSSNLGIDTDFHVSPSVSVAGTSQAPTSPVVNHIGTINISKELDGDYWLAKLTRDQELISKGLTPQS